MHPFRFSEAAVFLFCRFVFCLSFVVFSFPAFSQVGDISAESLKFKTKDGEREVAIAAPKTKVGKLPLIIVLHGALGSHEQFRSYMGFDSLAAKGWAVIAYPTGIDRIWNDGRPAEGKRLVKVYSKSDDVGFMRQIVDQLSKRDYIDPTKVYIVGMGNGGHLVNRLVCETPETFAAVASLFAPISAPLTQNCPLAKKIAILMMNGTADPLAYWDGYESPGDAEARTLSVPQTFDFWGRRLSCIGATQVTFTVERDKTDGSFVFVDKKTNCARGAEVALYRVVGGGHQIPSVARGDEGPFVGRIVGARNRDIEGYEEVWNFLKRFSR